MGSRFAGIDRSLQESIATAVAAASTIAAKRSATAQTFRAGRTGVVTVEIYDAEAAPVERATITHQNDPEGSWGVLGPDAVTFDHEGSLSTVHVTGAPPSAAPWWTMRFKAGGVEFARLEVGSRTAPARADGGPHYRLDPLVVGVPVRLKNLVFGTTHLAPAPAPAPPPPAPPPAPVGSEVFARIGPFARHEIISSDFPAMQYEWNAVYNSQPLPATSGAPKIEIRRNGALIHTYADFTFLNTFWDTPPHLQAADEIWVYPAVYDTSVTIGQNNGAFWLPDRLTFKGVVENNRRPVIKPSTKKYDLIELLRCDDFIWDGIDLNANADVVGSGPTRALVTIKQARKTTIFRNCRIHGGYGHNAPESNSQGVYATNGADWSGTIVLENLMLYQNGGPNGPQHNVYINQSGIDPESSKLVVRGCFSHSPYNGHCLKSRVLNVEIEGNYFMGVPFTSMPTWMTYATDSSDSNLLGIHGGGAGFVRNNIFVKNMSGNNANNSSNTYMIGFADDQTGSYGTDTRSFPRDWPGKNFVFEVYNNTFISYSSQKSKTGTGGGFAPWTVNYHGSNGTMYDLEVAADGRVTNTNQYFREGNNVYIGMDPWNGSATGSGNGPNWRTIVAMYGTSIVNNTGFSLINLPGIDTGDLFSLKTSVANGGTFTGSGGRKYDHQCGHVARTDNNKGAR